VPHVLQWVGLSGKNRCLYSPVGTWLVIQRVMRDISTIDPLAVSMKKLRFGLFQMLGMKRFLFRRIASHCRPLYSWLDAWAFHHVSMLFR
jgi:hypothetical protein